MTKTRPKAGLLNRWWVPLVMLICIEGLAAQSTTLAKPNVVLITSNDAGWADFGFQGSKDIPTPNLDRLARRAVRFESAYAAAVAAPSMACIQTGLLNSRLGFETNPPLSEYIVGTAPTVGIHADQVTLFDELKSLGYSTGHVGKWQLGAHKDNVQNGILFHRGNTPTRLGVDEFHGLLTGSRPYWAGQASGLEVLRHQSLNRNGLIEDRVVEDQLQGEYVTEIFGDWSVDFIERHHENDEPFFLCCAFTASHRPLQAKRTDLRAIDAAGHGLQGTRRTYAATMLCMDRQIGRILDALRDPNADHNEEDSIEDRTLVIFAGDNGGDCCGEDPNGSSNGILRGGKGSVWEGGIRVPMLIAGAGVQKSRQGSVMMQPVHLIDLLPTITNVCASTDGIDFERDLDGVDLMPFVNGDQSGSLHEELYLWRGPKRQVALRMGDWKLLHRDDIGFALFDLAENPAEDLAFDQLDKQPELVQKMKRVLTDYDVQMPRPYWGVANHCTEFRFRESLHWTANWSDLNMWSDEKLLSGFRTLTPADGFANTGLVFRSRRLGGHVSHNDMTRTSGLPFMANYIKIRTREEEIRGDATLTIRGNPLLLTHGLEGRPASILLDSVSPAEHRILFDLKLQVQLYSDLTLSGDGNDEYRFSGGFFEYGSPVNIVKVGKSVVTVAGASHLSGKFELISGTLRIEHPAALGEATVIVRQGAKLVSSIPLDTETRNRIHGDGLIVIPD